MYQLISCLNICMLQSHNKILSIICRIGKGQNFEILTERIIHFI